MNSDNYLQFKKNFIYCLKKNLGTQSAMKDRQRSFITRQDAILVRPAQFRNKTKLSSKQQVFNWTRNVINFQWGQLYVELPYLS